MNTKNLAILTFFIAWGMVSNAQTQKFGYIEIPTVFDQLPETKKAKADLEAYAKQLEKSLKDQEASLKTKYDQAEKDFPTMSETLKQATQRELQAMGEKLQIARRDAQEQLSKKENELLKPVEDKISKAIKDVASESGYTYIFNKENLLHFPPADDISTLVLKKLGVTPGAANPTANNPNAPKTATTPK
jgi:outer membrane protein